MDNFLNPPDADEHRRNLQYAAMPHLARAVVESGDNAEKIGERVREAIDGLLGIRREAGETSRPHDSDCAQHNAPAMPAGPCDCGAAPAPKVTPADVEAAIASEHYFLAADGAGRLSSTVSDVGAGGLLPAALHMTTTCTLVTKNGHSVVGVAYCADPARFNAQTGRDAARADAIRQLWPMVIYAERERLAAGPSIQLTPSEVQSGVDRVCWAEWLIRQLPADHEGRNSWLLNFGTTAPDLRPAASDDDF